MHQDIVPLHNGDTTICGAQNGRITQPVVWNKALHSAWTERCLDGRQIVINRQPALQNWLRVSARQDQSTGETETALSFQKTGAGGLPSRRFANHLQDVPTESRMNPGAL